MDAQPGDLLLEGVGEARCVMRPRDRCDDDAVLGALHAHSRVFDERHGRSQIERPPASRSRRAIVNRAPLATMRASASLSFARSARDDELAFF